MMESGSNWRRVSGSETFVARCRPLTCGRMATTLPILGRMRDLANICRVKDELASHLGRPIVALPARTDTMRFSVRGGDNRTAVNSERCVAPAVRGPLQVAKEISGAHRFDNFEDSSDP